VQTRRGSSFVLCDLSRTDVRFSRYPALPIITCAGFEAGSTRSEPN
jgi:proteasome lid subunit RPN8/RPN11